MTQPSKRRECVNQVVEYKGYWALSAMRPDSWSKAKWEGGGQLGGRSQKLREGVGLTQTARKKEQ